MNTYQNNELLTASDVLLMYSGKDRAFCVPDHLAGQTIRKIGMGAFCGAGMLESVSLGEHIAAIGKQAFSGCISLRRVQMTGTVQAVNAEAFSGCPMLEEVCVKSLLLSRSELESFEASCSKGPGGVRISAALPRHPLIQQIVSSINYLRPPCMLQPEIPVLFCESGPEKSVTADTLCRKKAPFACHVSLSPVSENQVVMRLINDGVSAWKNSRAETENDLMIRKEAVCMPERCVLFSAERCVGEGTDNFVYADVHIWIGQFYWPSVSRVVWEGTEYFVYRRLYMSSNAKLGYCRRDIAVYGRDGVIDNEEIARGVYAKYILPALL